MQTSSASTNDVATGTARYAVDLIAGNFQVTATNRLSASKYAADDAREFLGSWNYVVGTVRPAAGEPLTRSTKTEPITVQVKDSTPDGGRDRLYTCDASITITVDALDAFSAGEIALQRVCAPEQLAAQLAAYREQAFWTKLLPVARASFDGMAEVLRRRGFDAAVIDNGEAQSLAIEVTENGERVGTFTLVKCVSAAGGIETAQRPVLNAGLHFVGEHDIEISSTPAIGPDLWFNDKPVMASDVACLDVDAFDELFDLVLEQCEDERAASAPHA